MLTGPPYALARFTGWPLPRHLPTWPHLQAFLVSPLSDGAIIKGLACVVWLWPGRGLHGITSPGAERGTPGVLAHITRGQWGIESVHWLRDTAWREDQNTGYAGNGPQVMASLGNIAVSLLHLTGITEILRTLQAICRDRTRMLAYLPL